MAGRFHLDRGLRVFVHGAIHDIGPVNQFRDRPGIEAETLLGHGRNETGAGLEVGIIELAIALVLLEVGGIGGREECALVMVEPPGDLRRTGIFEIDDRVLIAVEIFFVEQGAGAV